MQSVVSPLVRVFLVCCGLATASGIMAQGTPLPIELLPLGKDIGIKSGQTVTPAYEGWYEDDDGQIALSFGYYNRNTEQELDIPVGPANRIIGAPDGDPDQGQPTHFDVERHWGVFTVKIPPDYDQEIVWHLENQGKTFHIAANRNLDYVIDAIAGDAGGNFPPQLRFSADSDWGHGPAGITAGPVDARVGRPLSINVEAQDDGLATGLMASFASQVGGGRKPPLTVTWFKHQGPGEVEFSEPDGSIPVDGGTASTEATFSAPGEYVIRARLTEFTGPEMSGHSQCCWSNGFLKVNVQ
ncbi:MAG: hypothetical protein RL839_09585 [Gammaproteobacteria bacterium]